MFPPTPTSLSRVDSFPELLMVSNICNRNMSWKNITDRIVNHRLAICPVWRRKSVKNDGPNCFKSEFWLLSSLKSTCNSYPQRKLRMEVKWFASTQAWKIESDGMHDLARLDCLYCKKYYIQLLQVYSITVKPAFIIIQEQTWSENKKSEINI